MIFWVLGFLLLAGFGAFCRFLLHAVCEPRNRPEGWEERRVEASGNPAWQELAGAGRDWLNRHETEELTVQSSDGFLLHGVLIPNVAARGTVLLFHGWRSSWEMDFICVLPFLHSLGLQTILVDQRAQGDSEGRWITFGIRERGDVAAWAEYAAQRFGARHPLLLQGLSMGAATVLMAAGDNLAGNVRGIVADCGFNVPADIIAKVWRDRTPLPSGFAIRVLDVLTRLFAGFGLREYSAAEALAKARYPVLFIHGTADSFVPAYMTKQAYEACAGDKTLLLVEGADHAMSYITDRAGVEEACRAFVERVLEEGS